MSLNCFKLMVSVFHVTLSSVFHVTLSSVFHVTLSWRQTSSQRCVSKNRHCWLRPQQLWRDRHAFCLSAGTDNLSVCRHGQFVCLQARLLSVCRHAFCLSTGTDNLSVCRHAFGPSAGTPFCLSAGTDNLSVGRHAFCPSAGTDNFSIFCRQARLLSVCRHGQLQ